jgi:hypothetical protein
VLPPFGLGLLLRDASKQLTGAARTASGTDTEYPVVAPEATTGTSTDRSTASRRICLHRSGSLSLVAPFGDEGHDAPHDERHEHDQRKEHKGVARRANQLASRSESMDTPTTTPLAATAYIATNMSETNCHRLTRASSQLNNRMIRASAECSLGSTRA